MLFTTLKRILKTSLLSLWRNRWLSLAAVLIMVMTLFTISIFSTVLIVTNKTTDSLRGKVDISVYFNDSTSKDQIFALQNVLLSRSDIKSVDYVSKEQALKVWQQRNAGNDKIRDLITDSFNPLPRSLEIKTNETEDLEKVNAFLDSADYKSLIKENGISYRKNKDLIDRLVKITSFLKTSGWILSSIFVLISILIIYNTVRLTIYARCEEIEIMRLVGASDWYVQGPFFVEGLSYGLVGSIISSIILYIGFRFTLPAAERYLEVNNLNGNYLGINFWEIVSIQVLVGLVLGTFCSVWATKRHLK